MRYHYNSIIFSILFTFAYTIIYSQEWKWLNPKPFGDPITQVLFRGNNGWMVPRNQTLYVTQDNGNTWQVQTTGIFFHNLYFINEHVGYGIGGTSIIGSSLLNIYRTEDGGTTWVNVFPDSHSETSLFFLNELHGWATGIDFYGYVLETIDGGDSWHRIAQNEFQILDETHFVHFTDSLNGWVLGGREWSIYTHDGGKTWFRDSLLALGKKMRQTDGQHLWIYFSFDDKILFTVNGGETWKSSKLSEVDYDIDVNDLFALSNDSVYAATTKGLFFSHNGGVSWMKISDLQMNSIWISKIGTGWGGGSGSNIVGIYYSSDYGMNWTDLVEYNNALKAIPFEKVDFIDQNSGWIISNNNILKSIDGGVSWTELANPASADLIDLHIIDSLNGWIITRQGGVLRTNDGGNIWHKYSTGTEIDLMALSALDSLICWVVGGYGGVAGEAVQGVILKTSDGGKSWIDQSTDIMSRLFGIDFIDSLNGWAVAGGGTIYDYGMILHTNDGGKSWNIQKNNSGLELYNVQFINKDDGWAYGFDPEFNSSLIYTKDGGKNWNGGNISIVAPNSDMKFIDANTGWLIGSFGEIYRTENGGLNWIEESSHTFQFLLGIDAIDAEHIWSVGVGGTILYKEQISSIKYASLPQRYLTKPEIYNFTLYPNPFNSSIKIKFEVAKPIILDLSVYDINGRIIDKIVTGELKSGVHIFTWDSKIISSGIYFFEVSSEKFRTVGKCILVK